jgi:archaellum component FlaC
MDLIKQINKFSETIKSISSMYKQVAQYFNLLQFNFTTNHDDFNNVNFIYYGLLQ